MGVRQLFKQLGLAALKRSSREWIPETSVKPTLVFSPHYDDETLGAGAAIMKLRERGVPVYIVFMTDGSTSHAQAMAPEELSNLRRQEGIRASAALGVDAACVICLEYPEKQLAAHREEAVLQIVDLLTALDCERVFIPSKVEPLIWSADHLTTTSIVFEAMQRTGRSYEVMEYLVWFWYHWPWVPVLGSCDMRQLLKLTWEYRFGTRALGTLNSGVTINELRERKEAALAEHKSQTTRLVTHRPWPVLADVAQGEFLRNFFASREWFKSYVYESK